MKVLHLRKQIEKLAEGLFLVFVFFFGQLPLRDFDIWFHIKSGELFVQHGLQFREVFSYTAYGREWIPFEWLFQIVIYLVSKIGLWAIPPFIGLVLAIEYFFFLRILRYIFGLKVLPSILLGYAFLASTYEFNTARPHTVAYAFFIIELFLILARIFKGKKWIYLTPVLTLVWTNVHSTGFLSWVLHLIFAFILLFQWLWKKQSDLIKASKELIILAIINLIITLTPPMGILDYKLLWHFFQEREFLGVFIAEWSTPMDNPFGFKIYTFTVISSLFLFLLITFRKKLIRENLTAIPFIALGIFGYSATRNIFLGTLGIFILLGWSLTLIIDTIKKNHKVFLYIFLLLFISIFYSWIILLKRYNLHHDRLYYPLQATEFLKNNLSGNIFNDYNYGGYMLYHLYPKRQVFIDGRADVYLCCEMRDYLMLAGNKKLPDSEYRKFLNEFWNKYDISIAVMVTTKHNVMRRIANLLNTDPDWVLVFWDDDSQIFVRRDGKNDEAIGKFGTLAATPYLRNPYVKEKMDEALKEYERMDSIAKSARTSNAIGFILLQKGMFDEAKEKFNEAVSLDPSFESPFMNLAELAVKEGDVNKALSLYYQALRLAPDRGLIYIRLGQLTLEKTGESKKAQKIWQDGLINTVDNDAKEKLKSLLSTLQDQKEPDYR
jgi:tetratricopeptide (TPR) repeat protein